MVNKRNTLGRGLGSLLNVSENKHEINLNKINETTAENENVSKNDNIIENLDEDTEIKKSEKSSVEAI